MVFVFIFIPFQQHQNADSLHVSHVHFFYFLIFKVFSGLLIIKILLRQSNFNSLSHTHTHTHTAFPFTLYLIVPSSRIKSLQKESQLNFCNTVPSGCILRSQRTLPPPALPRMKRKVQLVVSSTGKCLIILWNSQGQVLRK